jgi:GT2 family glycosyltransferase
MDLSILIVNANSRDALLRCLASLEASVASEVATETLVLDNASDDRSAELVRSTFPGVSVIAQPFRAGFGANQNTLIKRSSGRYVYLLNPDTESRDWALASLVAELDAHPRVAALGPRLVYPDGHRQDSAWRFPTPFASLLGLLTLGRVGITQSTGERPRSVDWIMGSAMILRRQALDEVGLFDENFFMYFEETDLCLRLRRAGWDVRYFPELTVRHEKGESTADVSDRRINEWWRGHHLYWHKHHSRLGARVAALAMGTRYAGAAVASLRHRDSAHRARLRLHARNARRVSGPGLRELAESWNEQARSARAGP